jgi:hypothetical protein
MYVIVGVLLTPIFMVLMAPSIGCLWLLMSVGWATKDYSKPKKPDKEESGSITNTGFKWVWWLSSSSFYKVVSSKWFRKFEPRESDFPGWFPKGILEWKNPGLLEKLLVMILFTILGLVWGFLSGFGVSLQFSNTILGDGSSDEDDVHTSQDQLFMKTGRFS